MKIIQISAYSGWGCTGRIAVGIHKVLDSRNYGSVIAWGRKNTASATVPNIPIGNYIDQQLHGLFTRITDKCGFGSTIATKKFLKKIDIFQPDIIQLHIMHGYYINLKVLFNYIKIKNIPVVWTFHDCWAFTGHCSYFDMVKCERWITGCEYCPQRASHPKSWLIDNSKKNWQKKKLLFTSISNLTIVTPSAWLAGLVKKSFFNNNSVIVINNGISIHDFKPTKSDFKRKLNIGDKQIVLGVSSTWDKRKGLEDFIKLNNELPKDYVVVLVGVSKQQKAILPSTIVALERTDDIRTLVEIYTAASVYVNPTYEDNYPTTNLEALACGTPVITYDTGGSVEAVRESGHGMVVRQGDIKTLVKGIIETVSKLPEKKCLYACNAEDNFIKYVELYEKIFREAGRRKG